MGRPLSRGIGLVGLALAALVSFQPPVLGSIKLEFEYLTDPEPVQHGLTYNDFAYADITEAALWPDKTFVPFTPVQDQVAAIHFGFERALPDGMGSLFVHCPTEGTGAGSPCRGAPGGCHCGSGTACGNSQ